MTRIAWGHRHSSLLFSATAVIALGFALPMDPTSALAEAQVTGKPDAVSVSAQNASIEEILVALANAFDVQFRSSVDLEKRLTGTYRGSLQQVVTRVLTGYDFFVKSGEKGLEITLIGSGRTIAVLGASSKVARRTDATPEQSPAANPAERPVLSSGAPIPTPEPSSGGPIPTKTLAEGPHPMPATSGSAPGPVPGPTLGPGPVPSPAPPGSTPPLPERGSSAVLPPPVAGTTPFSAPPSAR
jgi:hypothetical protein